MKTKNFLMASAIILGASLTFTSCSKDDDNNDNNDIIITPTPTPSASYVLSGTITSDKTLDNNQVWYLDGRVIVASGVKLTIEAGSVIKGYGGTGVDASTLLVARGATIDARGTAAEPIIFTSISDDINVGGIEGPNLNPQTHRGLWGGVIILGAAPISAANGSTAQIEGIPADVVEGNYGGSTTADNSGYLQYVSIRHGGTEIGAGNEINGLTLGGVGSGTTIDHIEIVGNTDDGIEFFGGSVNVSDAIVWNQGDDGFDVDQAYSGTINNIAYVAGADSDHALEIDGAEGATTAGFTLHNGKLKGGVGEYGDFRDGAMGTISNLFFFGFDAAADLELDDDVTSANRAGGTLSFSGLVFDAPAGVTITDISADKAPNPTGNFDVDFAVSNSVGTTPSAGNTFNKSAFDNWTWAYHYGKLSDF